MGAIQSSRPVRHLMLLRAGSPQKGHPTLPEKKVNHDTLARSRPSRAVPLQYNTVAGAMYGPLYRRAA